MSQSMLALRERVANIVAEVMRTPYIIVGVSNRHAHLSKEDIEILFDKPLTSMREMMAGNFAADQTVTIKGPKNGIKRVRILGPSRSKTQVEVSLTDSFVLGIQPPIAESGDLTQAAELTIINPNTGASIVRNSAIAALRHVHLSPEYASKHGLRDKQMVSVEFTGIRSQIFSNTLVRVGQGFTDEMHVDTDEANSAGICTGDVGRIIINEMIQTPKASGSSVFGGKVLTRENIFEFCGVKILNVPDNVAVTDLAKEEAARMGINIRRIRVGR